MALLKNSVVVAAGTMVSRWLGFARDLLIADRLGAGMASDAFFIALQLPNLLRRLLGEGAFNVAFVPLLAGELAKSDTAARAFAEAVLSWLFFVLLGVTVLGVLLMPEIVGLMVPGWRVDADKFALTVVLGRVTFPYLMMICLAAFLGALCNVRGKFAAYALVPVFLNVALLAGLAVTPWIAVAPVTMAAWCVPVGGMLQILFMLWAVRRLHLKLRLRLPHRHGLLGVFVRRIGPAAVGVGVLQLSLIIDNFVASWVGAGAVSYLQYANRFYQFPLALIGIAVATVLLPHLAVLLGEGNRQEATRSFTQTLAACLTLAAGAAVGLLVLAPELMVTLLRHGNFTLEAAQATAWVMRAYVLGLPAYIFTKVTAPAFFASGDPTTPVKASGVALSVNFMLNVALVLTFRVMGLSAFAAAGIAFSTAAGGWTNAFLQWRWLRKRRVLDVDGGVLNGAILRMLGCGAVLALVLGLAKMAVPFGTGWGVAVQIVWVVVVGGAGLAAFAGAAHRLGLVDFMNFYRQITARRGGKARAASLAATAGGEEA